MAGAANARAATAPRIVLKYDLIFVPPEAQFHLLELLSKK
jgi:hypothetical protein